MKVQLVIYPSCYNCINKIDYDYAFEQITAKKYNLMTELFNFDDFILNNKKLKLNLAGKFIEPIKAIYRGWMLSFENYTRFYNELKALYNIELITTPEQYRNTHYFIRSYDKIKEYTPKTIWFRDKETINWNKVRNELGDRFIVKDYVKSVKGFDFPQYLSSNLSDKELDNYIEKFKEIRGELYTGGIVIKQYVELDKSKDHTHEYRAFFSDKGMMMLYNNSNNNEDEIPIESLFNKDTLKSIDSPFYTIDFARLENGNIVIIEIGDGQVSGIPSVKEAEQLYSEISKAFN